MAWKLLVGAVVIVIAGAVGLVIYGGQVVPPQAPVEQVVPNDRLGN